MFLCVCLFLRLVSSIHAIMATTAGVIVVSSCHGNVINDRLDFMSLIPLVKQWFQVAAHIFPPLIYHSIITLPYLHPSRPCQMVRGKNWGGTSLSFFNYRGVHKRTQHAGDLTG